MEQHKISIGDNIKEALFHARRTRPQLAEALGVHKNTVNKWIYGESEPGYGTLGRIANLTGQNILTLIDPDQVPFNRKPEVNFESRPSGEHLNLLVTVG